MSSYFDWTRIQHMGPPASTGITSNTSGCYTQQVFQLAVQFFDSGNIVFLSEFFISVQPSMLRGKDWPIYVHLAITQCESPSHSIWHSGIQEVLAVSHCYIGAPCSAATSNHGDKALMWTKAAVPVHLTPGEDGNQCSLDTPPRLHPPSLSLSVLLLLFCLLKFGHELWIPLILVRSQRCRIFLASVTRSRSCVQNEAVKSWLKQTWHRYPGSLNGFPRLCSKV